MSELIHSNRELNVSCARMRETLARWRAYPLAFVMEGTRAREYGVPTAWQANVLQELRHNRRVSVRSGHGVGKTRAMAWALWWVMTSLYKPGFTLKIPCTGPSGGNLEDVLWSEINVVHKHLHPFLAEQFTVQTDRLFHFQNPKEWFASLRTSRKECPDALQGFHGDPMFFLIDEGSGVPDEVFEVASGSLSSKHAYALMFGNPVRLSGYFYESHRPKRGKKRVWVSIRIDCRDQLDNKLQTWPFIKPNGEIEEVQVHGRVSQDYIDEMTAEYGVESPVFCARVSGDFPKSEKDQVIKTQWLDDSTARAVRTYDEQPIVMGVDVAWMGDDDSGFAIRKGPEIRELDSWHGNDTVETSDKVVDRWKELNDADRVDSQAVRQAPNYIVIDANGVGAGVYDQVRKALKREDVVVLPVMVGSAAPRDNGPKYHLLRDWLWWKTRTYFRTRNPFYTCDRDENLNRLIDELGTPNYTQKEKAIWVESKKNIKARTGSSPDLADCLVMTFFIDWSWNRYADKQKLRSARNKGRKKQRKRERAGWRAR